ncbi:MAG TPA: HAMP domain-containing sensor histidine kinase [Puia sp.]|nr:HAMP domain-containing sensor histidine kinase [Puia sp.]
MRTAANIRMGDSGRRPGAGAEHQPFAIFRRIYVVVFLLIAVLGLLFVGVTYVATTSFYAASTQLLNKDVAGHIAKFTSPYGREGFDRQKADSVFYQAMVISPSAEVYFLDTSGKVIYFHGDTTEIQNWRVDLAALRRYIESDGLDYVSGSDPRDVRHRKIFSAAVVEGPGGPLGYSYVIFGNQQYRSVTQMLVNSRVTPAVLETVLLIVGVSLAVTVWYIRRARRRYELIEHSNRAVASEKERRDFMTNMAHDLRTPLAIARGYAETLQLKRGQLGMDEEREYGELVLNKIRQVEKMVGAVFELSKMESASFEMRREPFIFSELVHEVVRGKGDGSGMDGSGWRGEIECEQCTDGAWVEGDISLMERVLQNLVVNAVAYTKVGGKIVVSLSREAGDLVCRISNDGEAVGEELLRWFNGEEGMRPKKSAIGLSIVKRILTMHGFLYGATSRGGVNTFWFGMAIVR